MTLLRDIHMFAYMEVYTWPALATTAGWKAFSAFIHPPDQLFCMWVRTCCATQGNPGSLQSSLSGATPSPYVLQWRRTLSLCTGRSTVCFKSRGGHLYLWIQSINNKYWECKLSTHILLSFECLGFWPGKIQFAITNQKLIHLNCITSPCCHLSLPNTEYTSKGSQCNRNLPLCLCPWTLGAGRVLDLCFCHAILFSI